MEIKLKDYRFDWCKDMWLDERPINLTRFAPLPVIEDGFFHSDAGGKLDDLWRNTAKWYLGDTTDYVKVGVAYYPKSVDNVSHAVDVISDGRRLARNVFGRPFIDGGIPINCCAHKTILSCEDFEITLCLPHGNIGEGDVPFEEIQKLKSEKYLKRIEIYFEIQADSLAFSDKNIADIAIRALNQRYGK